MRHNASQRSTQWQIFPPIEPENLSEQPEPPLSALHGVHPTQLTSWKNELLEGAAGIFGGGAAESVADQDRIRELHEKIGKLSIENDFLGHALGKFPGSSGRR